MIRLLQIAVLLLPLCAFAGAGAPQIPEGSAGARAAFDLGMKHYNVGEYRAALDAFRRGYFAKPDPVFLFNMGQCYRQLGDPEASARQYRAYLREMPRAENRHEVEGFIAAADAQLEKRAANAPPSGVLPTADARKLLVQPEPSPVSAPSAVPTPVAISALPPAEPGAPIGAIGPRRRWLWPTLAAGTAAVVGAVVLGLALGLPANASARPGSQADVLIP